MVDAINQLVAAFESTWTWATFVVAVLAGVGLGYVVLGRLAIDPAYLNPDLTARAIGFIVVWTSIAAGIVFYIGQSVASAVDGDPNWARIVSRFGLWVVYAIGLGAGTGLRVHDHLRITRAIARARALREIENGSK